MYLNLCIFHVNKTYSQKRFWWSIPILTTSTWLVSCTCICLQTKWNAQQHASWTELAQENKIKSLQTNLNTTYHWRLHGVFTATSRDFCVELGHRGSRCKRGTEAPRNTTRWDIFLYNRVQISWSETLPIQFDPTRYDSHATFSILMSNVVLSLNITTPCIRPVFQLLRTERKRHVRADFSIILWWPSLRPIPNTSLVRVLYR